METSFGNFWEKPYHDLRSVCKVSFFSYVLNQLDTLAYGLYDIRDP